MNKKENNSTPALQDKNTGSPNQGEPVFLMIGKLRRAHGIHGEILMDVSTDFPERLHPGKAIFVGEQHKPCKIENLRWANKNIIIKLCDVNTPEEIVQYRNQYIYISSEDLPELPDGEFYHHQLLGLMAETEDGTPIGIVKDILETGANDVYVIETEAGKEILLPAIFDVILSYDLDAGRLIVRLPDYL